MIFMNGCACVNVSGDNVSVSSNNMQGHFIEQQLTCESHGWSNSVDFTLPVSDDMLSLEPYLIQLFSEPYENVEMTISKIPNDNSRK